MRCAMLHCVSDTTAVAAAAPAAATAGTGGLALSWTLQSV
jgi:hypothetical protein